MDSTRPPGARVNGLRRGLGPNATPTPCRRAHKNPTRPADASADCYSASVIWVALDEALVGSVDRLGSIKVALRLIFS
jgi:hypothetical protein